MIGATLILGLLGSVTWSITLAAAGLVYGAVGVFVLGVQLDYALLAGALVLVGALTGFTSPLPSDQTTSTSNTNEAAAARLEKTDAEGSPQVPAKAGREQPADTD